VVRSAPTGALALDTLYAILRLRAEVFVVEQDCPYLDIDGRDLEPDCVQLWVEDAGTVVATARLLTDPDGHRIGRICTAPPQRSRGLGAQIVNAAIELAGSGPITIDAQSQLTDWYATFGFEPTGRVFVEDGISHTEMRRS
jgi:ElaA protein